MSSIVLLFLCLLLGLVLQRMPSAPRNTHVVLNQFVINVGMPAMALYYIPKIELSSSLIFPVLMPWIHIGLSFLFFGLLGRFLGWSRALTGCLILTAGFGNTSFVGIPVIQALFGEEGVKVLMMVDLPGCFVAISTLGLFIASLYAKGATSLSAILKRIAGFPPFWAFIFAFALNLLGFQIPETIDGALGKLAATVSPLALTSVGFQLKIERKSKHWPYLFLGLGFQLLLIPACIFLLYRGAFGQSGLAIDVSIIEAAMAPNVTASIIASNANLKPRLCNMMLGIGIPLSFITIAFWYFVML